MYDIQMVTIDKMDVLMEDFSNIQGLIESYTKDREKLLASRNTWEVNFFGYDDDPREIPEIPEVVNWIRKSVDAGIPWFYFMRTEHPSYGLLSFMICCGADQDTNCHEQYFFDKDRTMMFIDNNLKNLADFVEKYDIPEELEESAVDNIMKRILELTQGDMQSNISNENAMRDKQRKEALVRLTELERLYGLNPKVKGYFEEGKLYYSYLTAGGYIGSIDKIGYDERYEAIVKSFEEQTSFLVYHVIERKNTISLLFVGDEYDDWQNERPTKSGVLASVVNVDSYENEMGYIKIDCLQGALYRIEDMLHTSLPNSGDLMGLSALDSEIVERLEILKNLGIETDLDISGIYANDGEICFSMLMTVLGSHVAVVNRISSRSAYVDLLNILIEKTNKTFYFLVGSTGHKLAFLFVSDDQSNWESEKMKLEKKTANAVVVDVQEMTAEIEEITFGIMNGGPIFVAD